MLYSIYEQRRHLFKPERDITELVFYYPSEVIVKSYLTYLCDEEIALPLVYPCTLCGRTIEESTYYRDRKGQDNDAT